MVMRRFHAASSGTMVATPGLLREMDGRGFTHLLQWSRGVDVSRFQPEPRRDWQLPRPVFVSVGRAAVEKNIPVFLELDLPGSKVVPGTGVLHDDLRAAALGALRLDRAACRAHAERCSWYDCAQLFLSHLVPLQRYTGLEKPA